MRGGVAVMCILGLLAGSLDAKEIYAPILSITEENDLFAYPNHQDRHYTQGLRVVLLGGDKDFTNLVSKLGAHLPAIGLTPAQANVGIVLFGQNLYTPEDLKTNVLIKTDRPFAGWLYTGFIFQRRGKTVQDVPVLENFEVDFGLTGPDSLGDAAQKQVHRWFVGYVPKGWRYQLETEPGLVLKYERLWRLSFNRDSARYFDFIPHIGGDLGNIFTFAEIGGVFRLGYNLPQDFGVQRIDSPASVTAAPYPPPCSAYVFGGVAGRAVGHNLFLDGNSFRGGPSVDKEIFVGDWFVGLAFNFFNRFEVSYTRVERTEEFKGQVGDDRFGSINAKVYLNF